MVFLYSRVQITFLSSHGLYRLQFQVDSRGLKNLEITTLTGFCNAFLYVWIFVVSFTLETLTQKFLFPL